MQKLPLVSGSKSSVLCLIVIAACVFAALISRLGPLQRIESTVSDYRFRLRGQRPVDDSLSLILVDQHTVKEYSFPFSRSYYAIVANVLAAAGAKAIAFDYIFDQERTQDKDGDQMLVEVTANNESVIHAWNASLSSKTSVSSLNRSFESVEAPPSGIPSATIPELSSSTKGTTPFYSPLTKGVRGLSPESGLYNTAGSMYLPYPDLLRASDSLGIVSVVPSADGSVRRIPLLVKHGGQIYFSFALLIACRALDVSPVEAKPGEHLLLRGSGKEIKIPIDSNGQMLVNYTGDMMSFGNTRFSFYDVYESIMSGESIVPISEFKDKVVLSGISDPVSSDICSTPFDNLFPGVAVHAMAVNTILQGRFLDEASNMLSIPVLLVFAAGAALVAIFLSPWLAAVSTVVLMAVLWFISYISFSRGGMMLSFVQPATGMILSFGGTLLYGYMEEIHKAKNLRNTFQEYVSPQVMQEIINRAEHIVPAERKKVTVLFSDLKGSVPWGEGLRSEPEKLFKELNEVIAEMMDVVLQYDGTVLRFTGDGLIAVYGAPLEQPSPALNAVLTGMEMQRKMENLNAQRVAAGEQALGMRVGINTGEAVVGSIGSKKRRQYTAIGDNVNVAQRTEGECEPGCVTITEGTYQEVKDLVVVESMGMRMVKGKSEPVMFYRVMSVSSR